MAEGLFITFEGGEGSGKSTQLKLFAEYLKQTGYDVIITREPGGTDVGKEIRRLLVEGNKDKFDEITEALLFYADRRINLTKVVWPALAEGKIVLSDRFNDSTLAYQYYGSGKFSDTRIMDTLYQVIAGDFKPDLTFLLDIDVKTGLSRSFKKAEEMANKELRFEQASLDFHERLRNGYLTMAKADPNRFRVINANQDISTVSQNLIATWNNFEKENRK
ncbi:MAG: dTMP kinase [Alphaproteobacteria bacterium]|nr:dTMP kinase [Alphaproteobacteria bacterium]